MTLTYFSEMMTALSCVVQGRHAFGLVGGQPYSAKLLQGEGPAEITVQFLVNKSTRHAATLLKKEKAQHQRWYGQKAGEGTAALVCLYTPPSDFYAKAGVRDIISKACAALCGEGLQAPQQCPLCGLGGCDAYAFIDEEYRPCHMACLAEKLKLPSEDRPLPAQRPGHIATGVLGAFLGAVVAAAPIWAIALNQGKIHFALYVFIPILSALLYRAFRGRASLNLGGAAVLASSALVTFALEMVWNWLLLSHQFGKNLPISETTLYYFSTHSLGTTVREMLFYLVALMVGFLAAMRLMRRYSQEARQVGGVVHGADFVRGSVIVASN